MEILRKHNLYTLLTLKDKQLIKIITGVRRSGKSTLLRQYAHLLQNEYGIDARQIHVINFESLDYGSSFAYKEIYQNLTKQFVPTKKNYILLDEVQRSTVSSDFLTG